MSDHDENTGVSPYTTPMPELDDHRHQAVSAQRHERPRRGTFDSLYGSRLMDNDPNTPAIRVRDFEEAVIDEDAGEISPTVHRSRRMTVDSSDGRSISPPNSVKAFAEARRRERDMSFSEPRPDLEDHLGRAMSISSKRSYRSKPRTIQDDAASYVTNKTAEEDVCFPPKPVHQKDQLYIDFEYLEEFIQEQTVRIPSHQQPGTQSFDDLRGQDPDSRPTQVATLDGDIFDMPSEDSMTREKTTEPTAEKPQSKSQAPPMDSNRFSFFSSAWESTIHAPELGDIVLPGEDIRGLFELPEDEEDGVWWLNITSATREEVHPEAFTLLLSFFTSGNNDDVRRLAIYARDADSVDLITIAPAGTHHSRVQRLVRLLIEAVESNTPEEFTAETRLLLKLITRIISSSPQTILPSIDRYYHALASLCNNQDVSEESPSLLLKALTAPFAIDSQDASSIYRAYAFSFLTGETLTLFEENPSTFSKAVSAPKLANAILEEFSTESISHHSKDGLLWLLAHFIDMGRLTVSASHRVNYLETLYTQLSALSQNISVRIGIKIPSDSSSSDEAHEENLLKPLPPYISRQLLSLVESDGISKLLQDFSINLAGSSAQEFRGTSLLAGYILTLLQSFPVNGDDIRMRLFLEQIPGQSGTVPTVKFLWQIMKQTTVFHKLVSESESPISVLGRYLRAAADTPSHSVEEQEWRVILLFLELYIFILRLSDDEDFFSGIFPQLLQTDSSMSRIRSCSLSLEDVKILTVFLKNTAFTLHYKAQELSKSREVIEAASKSRMDSYFGSSGSTKQPCNSVLSKPATRLDLDSLRSMVTVAMKMLYERDSRKQFLPMNHWLMTSKLDKEDFITAVITEEQRQIQEEDEDSDQEMDSDVEADLDADAGFYSTLAGQRLSRHARLERLKTQQKRVQRERRLAELGPKLEILKHMPFAIPFETRVVIFRQFIHLDRARREGDSPFPSHPFARHHARIRRQKLFEDAYKQFYELGEGLKDPIQITFVDQFGAAEAGIDGGGVTKEFLISVTSEAFGNLDKGPGMFTSNEKGLLYPDPSAVDVVRESLKAGGITESDPEWKGHMSSLLKRFEFLGRIVGKCIYEGILVDLAFAGFFLLKWASVGPNDENNYKGSVNDLRDMDEDLYKGMLRLKNYPGDISELGIDFTVADQVSQLGEPVKTMTRNLIANGDQVHVTNDNRLLYISYIARHRLVVQPSLQTAAFLRGLRAIIRPSWLSMFNQSELQRLVGGDSSEIDIEDLRQNTIYSGLYEIGDDGQEHDTIKLFWKVMEGFTDAQRRDVLKYVSSTPRAPLLGFSQLKPKFSIRDGGTDEERLPSTSTCVNLLKLPRYTSEETLREKLLYAITSGAGFDLS